MCAVSNVGDQWTDIWRQRFPQVQPEAPQHPVDWGSIIAGVSRQEFDQLKKDVQEMKEMLLKAKKEDEQAGTPDCEMESKVAMLKKIAEAVGISLDEVFATQKLKDT